MAFLGEDLWETKLKRKAVCEAVAPHSMHSQADCRSLAQTPRSCITALGLASPKLTFLLGNPREIVFDPHQTRGPLLLPGRMRGHLLSTFQVLPTAATRGR